MTQMIAFKFEGAKSQLARHAKRVAAPAAFLLAALAMAPSAAAAGCPNEAIREAQGAEVLALPDCMALEQVSPAKKGNQLARLPGSISADGKRVVFKSFAWLDPESPVNDGINGDVFLANRDASGWTPEGVNLPYGLDQGLFGFPQSSFTPDLRSWIQAFGSSGQELRFYQEGVGHSFTVLSPILINLTGNRGPAFQGASEDHSHVYFRAEGNSPRDGTYLPDDPQPAGAGEDGNLYVSHLNINSEPVLELLARDLNGKAWGGNCGARLGGIEPTTGPNLNLRNGNRNQGAISADGSRVYFSTRPAQPESGNCTEANKKRIMLREETPAGPVISELIATECDRVAPACSATDGDDAYQGASVDQSKVYFTTTRQLADSDLDGGTASCDVASAVAGCDLYLLDLDKPAGERLTQVSAGEDVPGKHETGKGANLYNSIAAISADGSRVYFAAQGALTADPGPKGNTAEPGQPNLYTWDAETEELDFIGALALTDAGSLWGSSGGTWNNGAYPVPIWNGDPEGPQTGGNGHVLLFKSDAQMTDGDTDGAFRDLFRYDALSGELLRISKGGLGGSDNGPFSANPTFGSGNDTPGTDYGVLGRPISEDGETIELISTEGLVAGDANGVEDVYLWRGGQVYRVPGSAQAVNTLSNKSALSADGSTLAYHTIAQVLPSDGDTAQDVYVARVGGGFPIPPPPSTCQLDEALPGPYCQDHTPPTPRSGTSTQRIIDPPDDVPRKPPCPKGKARKKGKCVKKAGRKASKKKQQGQKRRAGAKRGGAK